MSDDPTDEENWPLLEKEISKITGFDCSQYSKTFLKRRIATRIYALNLDTGNVKSYKDYITILNNNIDEKDLLLKELTIHVTSFFRNKDAYDVFIATTMMELLNKKKEQNNKKIKIWCAGCSSGEEPYSIAMILRDLLGERINDFSITILGTDLSAETIEKAKKGVYEEQQLKEAPADYVEQYFNKNEVGLYLIKDEVKNMVRFEAADILDEDKPKFLDVLFCRNTVIYFEKELKEKLYVDFYNCLAKRGYFVMGMTESLSGKAREMFIAVDNANRIYQKKE